MAKKGFRNFGTLDPAALLTALALLLAVSHVSAEISCTLSMTSSTNVLQDVSLDISCSGSASTSTQPHVWIDSSLNLQLSNLTGATTFLPFPRVESVRIERTRHIALAVCMPSPAFTKLCVRMLHQHCVKNLLRCAAICGKHSGAAWPAQHSDSMHVPQVAVEKGSLFAQVSRRHLPVPTML